MTMASSIDMMKMEETSDHHWNPDNLSQPDNSDIEHDPAHGSSLSACEADHWFGRKYFECTIAQDIFTRTDAATTYPSIDAEFERAIRCFPYATAASSFLASVSTASNLSRLPGISDSYRRLITLVGMTMRIGTTQEKRKMIDILRKCCNSTYDPSDEGLSAYRFVDHHTPNGSAQVNGSPPRENDNKDDLASFTMMLNERANREGVVPNYQTDRDPDNPRFYKCILTYRGCTFGGVGSSKAIARHQASKDACKFLQGQQEPTI